MLSGGEQHVRSADVESYGSTPSHMNSSSHVYYDSSWPEKAYLRQSCCVAPVKRERLEIELIRDGVLSGTRKIPEVQTQR